MSDNTSQTTPKRNRTGKGRRERRTLEYREARNRQFDLDMTSLFDRLHASHDLQSFRTSMDHFSAGRYKEMKNIKTPSYNIEFVVGPQQDVDDLNDILFPTPKSCAFGPGVFENVEFDFDNMFGTKLPPASEIDDLRPVPPLPKGCRFVSSSDSSHSSSDLDDNSSDDPIPLKLDEDEPMCVRETALERNISSSMLETVEENAVEDETPSHPKEPKDGHPFRKDQVVQSVELTLSHNSPLNRCDMVTCDSCIPIQEVPKYDETVVVVYACPGSGKTHLINSIPLESRSMIYDTDHPCQVPKYSIVFTNRPDIAECHSGISIAYLQYRRQWMQSCLSKCPHANVSWFHDAVKRLRNCVIIRGKDYISNRVRLKPP